MVVNVVGVKFARSASTYAGSVVVIGAGDVNGDGFSDLFIGPRFNQNHNDSYNDPDRYGDSFIVFGQSELRSLTEDLDALAAARGAARLLQVSAIDVYDGGVAATGDVTGDGFDDLLLRAQFGLGVFGGRDRFPVSGVSGQGYASGNIQLYGVYGFGPFAGGGDFNGDGVPDFAVPDNGFGYGDGTATLIGFDVAGGDFYNPIVERGGAQTFTIEGPSKALSFIGDFNGDGFDDIALGRPYSYNGGFEGVIVVFGRPGAAGATLDPETASSSEVLRIASAPNSGFGGDIAALGDVNGDGLSDLASLSRDSSYELETLHVIFGAPSGSAAPDPESPGARGFLVTGLSGDRFASDQLAAIGDVNEDGFDDFAFALSGDVLVVFGSGALADVDISLLTLDRGLRITGPEGVAGLGTSLTGLGDFNGDGVEDFAIGAESGEVFVVHGGSARLAAVDAADGVTDGVLSLANLGVGDDFATPLAGDDVVTVTAGFFTQFENLLLANDSSPRSVAVRIVAVDDSALLFGELDIGDDGEGGVFVQYDATSAALRALRAGESIEETFTYTISDGLLRATAEVRLIVQGRDDAPVAVNDLAIGEGTGSILIDALANDSDPEGGALMLVSVSAPGKGSAEVTADGRILYTPDTGSEGSDRFTYVVRDDTGLQTEGVVEVLPRARFAGLTVEGAEFQGFLGTTAAAIGDFNGDGIADAAFSGPGGESRLRGRRGDPLRECGGLS